jgi:hypothetical protein
VLGQRPARLFIDSHRNVARFGVGQTEAVIDDCSKVSFKRSFAALLT